jgi:membrane-associated protease RseP (regulator of RpoE activity)
MKNAETTGIRYLSIEEMLRRIEQLRATRGRPDDPDYPADIEMWAAAGDPRIRPQSFAELLAEESFFWIGDDIAVRFDDLDLDFGDDTATVPARRAEVRELSASTRPTLRTARMPLRAIAVGAVAAGIVAMIGVAALFANHSQRTGAQMLAAARQLKAGSAPYNEIPDNEITENDQLENLSLIAMPPEKKAAAQIRFSPRRAEERIREALALQGFPDLGISASATGDVYLAGDVYSLDEAKEAEQVARHADRSARIYFLHPELHPSTGPAWFGVTATPEADDLGAKVTSVAIGSPAEKAGIRVGDLIRGFDGELVPDVPALNQLLGQYRPGDRVAVRVWRDGGNQFMVVRLGEETQVASIR